MAAGLKEGRTQTQRGLTHVTVKTEMRVLCLYVEDSKASSEYYRSTRGFFHSPQQGASCPNLDLELLASITGINDVESKPTLFVVHCFRRPRIL